MRKIRLYIAILRLFIRRFLLQIVAGIGIGVFAFIFRENLITLPIFSAPQKIGFVGRFTAENLPLTIQRKISTGLTQLDNTGEPIPGIANSWENREEGKVWVFKLKDGLRWQDGTRIASQDLKYNFPGVTLGYPDDQTLEFTLQDPYAAFPILVSRPVFKKALLGNRESQVKTIKKTGQFIEEILLLDTQAHKRITYHFYPTEEALRTAFKLGEIQTIEEISDPKELSNWKDAKLGSHSDPKRFVGLFLNTQDQYLSEKSLRQALGYAINKEKLSGNRALGPISPDSWAFNSLVKPYDYNLSRAKELFGKLGKEIKPQSFTIATIPSLLGTAELIAQDWRELGLEVIVQVAAGVPQEFQALLATQEIPPDPDQYALWHSTQKETNITHYNNPRVDKLLEDGRRTLDKEERRKIYLDFQRFLIEDVPLIPLYHPTIYTINRK